MGVRVDYLDHRQGFVSYNLLTYEQLVSSFGPTPVDTDPSRASGPRAVIGYTKGKDGEGRRSYSPTRAKELSIHHVSTPVGTSRGPLRPLPRQYWNSLRKGTPFVGSVLGVEGRRVSPTTSHVDSLVKGKSMSGPSLPTKRVSPGRPRKPLQKDNGQIREKR